jgi:hypothetical protein
MNWTTVKDALHTWVRTASGLAAAKVMWGAQNIGRGDSPFISLRMMTLGNGGAQDWLDIEDAEEPEAGAEVTRIARGQRTMTFVITCYAAANAADANEPHALLEGVRIRAALPSFRTALRTANIGIGSFEDITVLDGIINTVTFEPRAVLTCRLHLTSEISETGTFIESAELEGTYT